MSQPDRERKIAVGRYVKLSKGIPLDGDAEKGMIRGDSILTEIREAIEGGVQFLMERLPKKAETQSGSGGVGEISGCSLLARIDFPRPYTLYISPATCLHACIEMIHLLHLQHKGGLHTPAPRLPCFNLFFHFQHPNLPSTPSSMKLPSQKYPGENIHTHAKNWGNGMGVFFFLVGVVEGRGGGRGELLNICLSSFSFFFFFLGLYNLNF